MCRGGIYPPGMQGGYIIDLRKVLVINWSIIFPKVTLYLVFRACCVHRLPVWRVSELLGGLVLGEVLGEGLPFEWVISP